MSANALTPADERIAARIDSSVTGQLAISEQAGGLSFANLTQVMEFAKTMAVSDIAIPKHLRRNVGACMAVTMQAVEWRMSPFAVANKSYSVNDRLSYEAQLVQAVILQRAPVKGRFKVEYLGDGDKRRCRVWCELKDEPGEIVEYVSPEFGKITPKNSPLWKSDPDQQQFYYSARAMCRRHFPDVLLGIYARDEIEDAPAVGPERARDVTPPRSLGDRLDAIAQRSREPAAEIIEQQGASSIDDGIPEHLTGEDPQSTETRGDADPETGEVAATGDEMSPIEQAVLDEARGKAMEGSKRLRLWMARQPERVQEFLARFKDELDRAASVADEAAAQADGGRG